MVFILDTEKSTDNVQVFWEINNKLRLINKQVNVCYVARPFQFKIRLFTEFNVDVRNHKHQKKESRQRKMLFNNRPENYKHFLITVQSFVLSGKSTIRKIGQRLGKRRILISTVRTLNPL